MTLGRRTLLALLVIVLFCSGWSIAHQEVGIDLKQDAVRWERAPAIVKVDRQEITKARRSPEVAGARWSTAEYWANSAALPPLPDQTKIVELSQESREDVRQTVVKLESRLSPVELSTFYTSALVADWILYRDTLSADLGWNGVFLQAGPNERSLGIFAVVSDLHTAGSGKIQTIISILLAEEV